VTSGILVKTTCLSGAIGFANAFKSEYFWQDDDGPSFAAHKKGPGWQQRGAFGLVMVVLLVLLCFQRGDAR
jgi:hypothetical protein